MSSMVKSGGGDDLDELSSLFCSLKVHICFDGVEMSNENVLEYRTHLKSVTADGILILRLLNGDGVYVNEYINDGIIRSTRI